MNQEVKALWLTALRSREITREITSADGVVRKVVRKFKQATGKLRRVNSDGSEGGMCCLGVLCELAVEAGVLPPGELQTYAGARFYGYEGEWKLDTEVLPRKVQLWAEVDENPTITGRFTPDGEFVSCLAALNDHGGTFDEIADVIEEEL
jgi:hypothetical protein